MRHRRPGGRGRGRGRRSSASTRCSPSAPRPEKLEAVRAGARATRRRSWSGDGINDAPALAAGRRRRGDGRPRGDGVVGSGGRRPDGRPARPPGRGPTAGRAPDPPDRQRRACVYRDGPVARRDGAGRGRASCLPYGARCCRRPSTWPVIHHTVTKDRVGDRGQSPGRVQVTYSWPLGPAAIASLFNPVAAGPTSTAPVLALNCDPWHGQTITFATGSYLDRGGVGGGEEPGVGQLLQAGEAEHEPEEGAQREEHAGPARLGRRGGLAWMSRVTLRWSSAVATAQMLVTRAGRR